MGIMSGTEALESLLEGNRRFARGRPEHPNQDPHRREAVASGQRPFAVVIGCSDSRVPPEIIFDQGIGDLFVVRVAGNTICDKIVLGSIEYAVDHLGVGLVVVLGHGRCGAVEATIRGECASECSEAIVEAVRPAVERVTGERGDLLDKAARANVEIVAGLLRSCEPVLSDYVKRGKLTIAGAFYNVESGLVDVIA